ncbi:hypothetical protein [Phormidesmis sp. 146-33]
MSTLETNHLSRSLLSRYPECRQIVKADISMVGSIEQIRQTLATLDKKIEVIGDEFYSTYSGYLTALGQVVQQQLILSGYHVCTEGYPEAFLKLSLSQRQQLQQALKALAKRGQTGLIACLKPIAREVNSEPPADTPPDTSDFSQEVMNLPSDAENALELLLNAARAKRNAQKSPPTTPLEILVQWQENLERAIAQQLQTLSRDTNRLLQQSDILPKHLPEPVLEAAAKAEGDPVAGTPNLLNLLIEASEKSSNSDEKKELSGAILHVVAVQLRLTELEFNDPTIMTWRNKLRDLKKRLQVLAKEYQKKQTERAIAEAQVMWRSTWSNDE